MFTYCQELMDNIFFNFFNNSGNESSRKPDKPHKDKSLNIDNKKKDNLKR